MVNRLITPTKGRLLIDGEDVAGLDAVELRRNIGYVIQETGLFPHMTIAQNIALVPRLKKWPQGPGGRSESTNSCIWSVSIRLSTAIAIRATSRVGKGSASASRVRSPAILRSS